MLQECKFATPGCGVSARRRGQENGFWIAAILGWQNIEAFYKRWGFCSAQI
jgi:hypothetical protein